MKPGFYIGVKQFLCITYPGQDILPNILQKVLHLTNLNKKGKCIICKVHKWSWVILQLHTSCRGILCLISSKNFNPILWAYESDSSFCRSSRVRCPFSYNLSAVAGPIPQTSPNKLMVRTFKLNCADIYRCGWTGPKLWTTWSVPFHHYQSVPTWTVFQ
jgi:hypothetical protein